MEVQVLFPAHLPFWQLGYPKLKETAEVSGFLVVQECLIDPYPLAGLELGTLHPLP